MKNFGKLIIIPILVMTLVIVGALVYKFFLTPDANTEPPASAASVQYDPYKNDETGKATNGFDSVTETSGNPATEDLEQELQSVEDDGGAAEIDQLQQEAEGL